MPFAFARPDRPAFDGAGGCLGTELALSLGYELTERIGLFARFEVAAYAGAANEDSPLFADAINASGFLSKINGERRDLWRAVITMAKSWRSSSRSGATARQR